MIDEVKKGHKSRGRDGEDVRPWVGLEPRPVALSRSAAGGLGLSSLTVRKLETKIIHKTNFIILTVSFTGH